MATTLFTLPTQSYPSGVQNVPSRNVTVGANAVLVTLDTSQMLNPATSFDLAFEVSYDGGTNWQFWAGGHRNGGPLGPPDRLGVPAGSIVKLSGPFAQPADSNTRIRGTVTIVGPITIGGTVAVE